VGLGKSESDICSATPLVSVVTVTAVPLPLDTVVIIRFTMGEDVVALGTTDSVTVLLVIDDVVDNTFANISNVPCTRPVIGIVIVEPDVDQLPLFIILKPSDEADEILYDIGLGKSESDICSATPLVSVVTVTAVPLPFDTVVIIRFALGETVDVVVVDVVVVIVVVTLGATDSTTILLFNDSVLDDTCASISNVPSARPVIGTVNIELVVDQLPLAIMVSSKGN
jgi:hypothetical protein